jgi:nucleoid DNA-binding protein
LAFNVAGEDTMHKSDLIRHVAAETGVSQAVAAKVINSALDAIVRRCPTGNGWC